MAPLIETAAADNARGMPSIKFYENIADALEEGSLEKTANGYQELSAKFKFMRQNFATQQEGLENRLNELKGCLETISYLEKCSKEKEGPENVDIRFKVADCLYTRATVNPKENPNILLWLGAGVMMECEFGEAKAMISKSISQTEENIKSIQNDLDFILVQGTKIDVSLARLHNYKVAHNKKV